jgi:putative transposase
MHSNPELHHRRSICLLGFDYSRPGEYFITLCIHDRLQHLFSEVIAGKMVLNLKIADNFTTETWRSLRIL